MPLWRRLLPWPHNQCRQHVLRLRHGKSAARANNCCVGDDDDRGNTPTTTVVAMPCPRGAHKTNTEGNWCERTLRCTCRKAGNGREIELGRLICPVHAASRILRRRRAENAADKAPLLANFHGKALSHEQARERIRRAGGEPTLTEHSLRRIGAQFYARRGVALAVIQFLGR